MSRDFRPGVPDPPRQPGQPWTYLEASAFLRVSVETLRRAKMAGTLRVIMLGRRVLIPDDEVKRVANFGLVAPDLPDVAAATAKSLSGVRTAVVGAEAAKREEPPAGK